MKAPPTMPETIVRIHSSRTCSNCAHIDDTNEYQCLNLVSMVDGSPMSADFACGDHQTVGEYRLDLHRAGHMVLGLA
jgi:hypothetical protein